ncbi:FxSxx-COOH system tetratricopeptide repeat protein [Nocardia sp. NPDC003693]
MSSPVYRVSPGESIAVLYAPEDSVWALWLQQLGRETGRDIRIRRLDAAGSFDRGAVGTLIMVVSEHLLRVAERTPSFWRGAAADERRLAVIVGTGSVPAAAARIPAVDLRALPDAGQARAKVARVLGLLEHVAAPETLRQAAWTPVEYPGRQLFVDYRSQSVPGYQAKWFYGREGEIDEMRAALANSGAVVLTGAAGTGKSWLAGAYVHRFRSQYDLIAWIPGENGVAMRTALARLAEPLGLSDSLPRSTVYRDVVEALRRTDIRYLIVYDNVTPDDSRYPGQYPLPRKPALLSEVVPWGGRGHVVFTSKVATWSEPQQIPIPAFSVAEGASFLRRHVAELGDGVAEQFSRVLDGSPVLLNALAHLGARGTDTLDETLLDKVRSAPLTLLRGAGYKHAGSIIGDSLRPLLDEPRGSNAWAAGELLRLLTAFHADQPISLALLTSDLDSGHQGRRLSDELAAALGNDNRRRVVLQLATRDSVAQLCADPLTDTGRALTIHSIPWFGIHDFLPKDVAETNRHLAHQVMCDADPRRIDRPALWFRYEWLWQQLAHTEVLTCARVAQPDSPCARLPELIANIVRALRAQGELTAASGLGEQAVAAWSPVLGAGHIGVVRIQQATGNALWQLGRLQEALGYAKAARDGVESQRGEYPEEYVAAGDLLAACLRMSGDWEGSARVNLASHAWARTCLGDAHLETLRAAHNLAVAYRMVGRFSDAMALDTANYEALRGDLSLRGDDMLMLHCLNNIARNHRELGHYEESVAVQDKVLRRFRELVDNPRHQHLLRGRKNMAVSYRKAGRYPEALAMQQEVLHDHIAVYGPEHPESIAARTNVANDFRMTADPAQALEYAREAHQLGTGLRSAHPFTAACAVNYAAALRALGRPGEALALDEEAIAIFVRRLGEDHPYTLAAQSGRASDLAALGRLDEAVELGRDTLERSRRIRGPEHPYTLQCATNLSLDLRDSGADEEASAIEAETLAGYVLTLGPDHPEAKAALARVRGVCDVEPPPM